MNNFTKEELIDIYDALMNTEIAIFENLPSKVQSMIDNYCEHAEKKYSRKTGKAICSQCDPHLGDHGDDIESRLETQNLNEFTLVELQLLDMELTTAILRSGKENCSDEYIALAEKVNSMCHNYCVHEWNFNAIMMKLILNPGMAFPVMCEKCGANFKW